MNTNLNDDGIEIEAAAKVAGFFSREYGMKSNDSHAQLAENRLVVMLVNALSSLGRFLSRRTEGQRILQETLDELHREHGSDLRRMVARIAGRSVIQSFSRVEVNSSSIVVTFVFDHRVDQEYEESIEPTLAVVDDSQFPVEDAYEDERTGDYRRLFHMHRN